MKDEINFCHNGGVVVYLLQSVAIHFNLTVLTKTEINALARIGYYIHNKYQFYGFAKSKCVKKEKYLVTLVKLGAISLHILYG